MQLLMDKRSGDEAGTLYHLANVLPNPNLKLDPLNQYQRVKNSFMTILYGYITSATLQHIGASNIDDADGFVPDDIKEAPRREKCVWLMDVIKEKVITCYDVQIYRHHLKDYGSNQDLHMSVM